MSLKKPILISLIVWVAALGACDGNKAKDAADAAQSGRDVAQVDANAQANPGGAAPEERGQDEDAARPSATSPGVGTLKARALLQIDRLLRAADLKPLTSARIESEELAGKPAAADYRARRFYPAGEDTYGVGLQVWKFKDEVAARGFVANLRPQYLGVEDAAAKRAGDGARGFLAARAGIQTQVFAPEKAPGYVAAISCDDELCKNGWDDVGRLAQLVEKRLAETGAAERGEEPARAIEVERALEKDRITEEERTVEEGAVEEGAVEEGAVEEDRAPAGDDTTARRPALENKRLATPLNRQGFARDLRKERLDPGNRQDVGSITKSTRKRGVDKVLGLQKQPRRNQ